MAGMTFADEYGPAALVTGASSGIGLAFARALAERGLDLLLVARRTERLDALAAELRAAHGVAVHTLGCDLARPDAAAAMLTAAAGLDVGLVVSNAGFGLKGEHAASDPAAITDMLMVNCNTPLLLAHGFIPRLRARGTGGQGRGGMIFTSSVEGLIGCPYSTAYSATKALVNALGEGLWGELSPEGIRILTLLPGATESEAAGLQGIDIAKLSHVMPAEEVAALALDHLADGPSYISSPHYAAQFEALLGLPRREALTMMARGMKR